MSAVILMLGLLVACALLGVLFGDVLGDLLSAGWRLIEKALSPPAAPAVEEPLANRLHKINETLDPFARDAAHTNELVANADFRNAVALLSDPRTPLDTVVDYAFGQASPLSCAAFAALKERPDGSGCRGEGSAPLRQPLRLADDVRARNSSQPPNRGRQPARSSSAIATGGATTVLLRHVLAEHFTALGDDDPAESSAPTWWHFRSERASRSETFSAPFAIRWPRAWRPTRVVSFAPPEQLRAVGSMSSFLTSLGRFWDKDSGGRSADRSRTMEGRAQRRRETRLGRLGARAARQRRTPRRQVGVSQILRRAPPRRRAGASSRRAAPICRPGRCTSASSRDASAKHSLNSTSARRSSGTCPICWRSL